MLLLVLTVLAARPARAQELDCTVSVDYSQLEGGTDYSFLADLEGRIAEYVNERSWTNDRFMPYERIDCTIEIYVLEAISLTEFSARLVVASRRPIYGTTQATPVVQFSDANWRFTYRPGQPLIYDPDQFDSLTSVLDFYAYVLLGYDYDTFSPLGGTPYFEQARRIAQLAPPSAPGWAELGNERSRSALVDQLLDPRYRALREAYFTYHFKGLDRFVTETEAARQAVLEALQALGKLYDSVSRSYVLDLFFATKYQELAAVFEDAQVSSTAYALLSQIDPAHLGEYDRLVQ